MSIPTRRWVTSAGLTAGLTVATSLSLAPRALAHDIVGSAANTSVPGFLPLGIEHMLLGWDHLLFIAGIVLLAGTLPRAAKLISIFVVGHSLTLIVATLAGWQVDPASVDIVIAASVLFVGVVGLRGRPERWAWFSVAIFAFGLVHGLGLSTRLQALGLPEQGMLARVVSFNVGVEIGQLLAIAVMVVIGRLITRFAPSMRAPRAAYGGLTIAGAVAAVVLGVLVATGDAGTGPRVQASGSCTVKANNEPMPADGGHPDKEFYEPAEALPAGDFGHVLGDGFVVVHYAPTLPAEQVGELRAYVIGPEGNKVVGGAKPAATHAIKAFNAFEMLACTEYDLDALRSFSTDWAHDPRSRSAG